VFLMTIRTSAVGLFVGFTVWLVMPLPASAQAQAVLVVTPTSVSVKAYAGTRPPPQVVTISNAGKGALKWSISPPTASWLTVSPLTGVNQNSVTVSFPAAFSTLGTYTASFVVRTATSAVTVNVLATILAQASAVYGPQPSISCPLDAVPVVPGEDLPSVVDAYPSGTSFCLQAGTHYPTSPINLKANDRLVGRYGAIIDGRNIVQHYDVGSTAIVRGWNCNTDCSGVLVQNLVIRNLPSYNCVGVYSSSVTASNNWTVDHNEVSDCRSGLSIGNESGATITYNYVHHNACGVGGYRERNTVWDHNDISGTSLADCKWADIHASGYQTNLYMTNNYIHDFAPGTAAIWLDTEGCGNVISGNTIIGASAWPAIDIEATTCTEITGNTVTLPADGSATGIFITNSQNTNVHDNLLKAPAGGGVTIFWDGQWSTFAVAGNYVHNNTIVIGGNTLRVGYFCLVVSPFDCASTMASNHNLYDYNSYQVPDASGDYWFASGSGLSWSQWQSAGQDLHGIK
jgi:hypothetical protein